MDDLGAAASWLALLADDDLALEVGEGTFERGQRYAGAGRVENLDSADRGRVLLATVRGTGRSYQTLVTATGTTAPVRWVSRCSCPVAGPCKHAVAVLLTARGRAVPADAVAADRPAEWERRLAPLLGRVDRAEPDGPALALVVELVDAIVQQGTRVRQVRLRPSRETRTGTWARTTSWADVVETGHGWNRLPPVHPGHREALARLHRLSGASTRAYAGRTDVDLAGLGPAGWDALRRAVSAGVALIGAPTRTGSPGAVTLLPEPDDVGLDVVRDADGLVVTARTAGLPVATADADEVLLVGDPGHGLVVREGADLVLVALAGPLPPAVVGLVLDTRPLRVPPQDADRFATLYLPRLAQQVRVASSDGSVEITGPVPPVLDVEVVPEPDHRVRVRLGLRYGEVRVRAAGRDDTVPRDHGAERRLVASLEVLDRVPGARSRASERVPWALAPETLLSGMDAVRFVDAVLPELEAGPDVHVTVLGELATFEEATEAPVIELGTADPDDGGTDWFDLHVTVTVDSEEVPFEPLFAALSRGESTMLLESGTWFRLDHPSLVGLRELIEEARGLTDGDREGLRLNRFHIGLWDELVALGVVGEQAARWSASVEAVRGLADAPRPDLPAGLTAVLRPYQHDGFHWLSTLWDARLGGVLADDMGLGKTVQVLALLARALEAGELDRPVLVVAPTSVTSTWASEAARFVPALRTTVVGATSRRRAPLAELVRGAHVVITSYAVLRIDAEEFRAVGWRGLVLDEAQFVKNHQSKTYQAARRLGAPFTLAVTGTPLENSLMDLWSMLSLAAPGLYPRPEVFTRTYRRPIESGARPDLLDTLRRRIRPLLLRRTKEQVASDLPPKQVQVLSVPMRPEHERLYHQHLQRERQRVLGLLEDPDGNRVAILASLTRLRQLSLHPALVDPEHAGRVASAKLDTLVQHLAEVVGEGHRALVFSQFTRFLRMARDRLHAEGLTTRYLDGSTRDRQGEIDAFRGGDGDAFLISLKAGGFGLTLTEADYVFVLDPWWNPAAENQAIDRAHRIGQERPVLVYRLVSAGTIEEKVVALQERKRDLFDRVVDDGGALSGPVTADDVRALLEG